MKTHEAMKPSTARRITAGRCGTAPVTLGHIAHDGEFYWACRGPWQGAGMRFVDVATLSSFRDGWNANQRQKIKRFAHYKNAITYITA